MKTKFRLTILWALLVLPLLPCFLGIYSLVLTSCTGLSPLGGSTLTAPTLTDVRASLVVGNADCMAPGIAWSAITLPECTAENVTDVTYALTGLPAELAFDATTRALSMAAGTTALPAFATAIEVTYTCSGTDFIGDPISASETFVVNDCDGGGAVDWYEFINSDVPALIDDVGYVPLNSLNVDTYLTPGPAPDRREIRTNLAETTGMDVLNPADDSTTISAASDIDGDGIANISDPNVFVAASTDTFVQTTYNNNQAMSGMLAADMNNDGFPDLVTGSTATGIISVYLWNSAAGSFNAAIDNVIAPPDDFAQLTAADFNGDGNLDIIAITANFAQLATVARGDGSGGLALSQVIALAGLGPRVVGVGDFDDDGFVDGAVIAGNTNNVRIYLWNNTLGQLVFDNLYATGALPSNITMADFNGDGFIDFATCNAGVGDVSVYLGNGTGSFAAATGSPFALASSPATIVTADMDLDGNLDLVASGNGPGSAVQILYGNGDGTFGGLTVYDPILYNDMNAADMDGDGDVDIAGVNGTFVTLLINSVAQTGTVGFTQVVSNVGAVAGRVTAADFNADNMVDLGFLTAAAGPPFPEVNSFIQQ